MKDPVVVVTSAHRSSVLWDGEAACGWEFCVSCSEEAEGS